MVFVGGGGWLGGDGSGRGGSVTAGRDFVQFVSGERSLYLFCIASTTSLPQPAIESV